MNLEERGCIDHITFLTYGMESFDMFIFQTSITHMTVVHIMICHH